MTAPATEPWLSRTFGLDETWMRPRPPLARQDVWVALGFLVFAALGLELVRSFGSWDGWSRAYWAEYLALVTGTVPLVLRRRYPLGIAAYAVAHWVVAGTLVPELGYQLAMQVAYFFAIYSGVAWARQRRLMLAVMGGIVVVIFGWLAWDFAMGSALAEAIAPPEKRDHRALLPAVTAMIVWSWIVNTAYLGGAILLGQANWRQARDRARLEEQAATIALQSATLRDQAVVDERLRIARELHDVVAHHVSVMGIQAAAARRVLTRDPDAATAALAHVEESSRVAVSEMRGLLGTLRGAVEASSGAAGDHAPEPRASDIAAMVATFNESGFSATYTPVEDVPAAIQSLPLPVGLSLYRTVAEALTNVRRHSTAVSASVTVRVARDRTGPRYVEAEVLNDGRQRSGTSGTGLGQLGIRERIALHGGTAEIGPRLTGGYRVRVRFPLKEES